MKTYESIKLISKDKYKNSEHLIPQWLWEITNNSSIKDKSIKSKIITQ